MFPKIFLLLSFLLLDFLYLLSSAESDSFLLIYFLHFLSSEESGLLDDESNDDGSESGFAGTCDFPFCFYYSIGCIFVMDSGVFVPIGIESNW